MEVLNLSLELERVVGDVVTRMDEYRHIDPSRLLILTTTARSGGVGGTFAKIHPLRFPDGAVTTEIRRGRRTVTCTMPTVTHRGQEILYLIYFLVPRFFDLPVREKLITILHELYHISPQFNGDIRRFPGKNYAHGSSTKRYNALMASHADTYMTKLAHGVPAFLEANMKDLRARHHVIVSRRMRAPQLQICDR